MTELIECIVRHPVAFLVLMLVGDFVLAPFSMLGRWLYHWLRGTRYVSD